MQCNALVQYSRISQKSKCNTIQFISVQFGSVQFSADRFSVVQLHLERWHLSDSALYSKRPNQTSREREMQAVSGLTDATMPLLGKPIFSMLWSVSGILTGYSCHHRTWSKQLTAPHSQNFAVQYFSPTHAIFCGLRNFGPFLDFCNRILMTCIFFLTKNSLMKLLVCNFVYVHRILCFLIELV